jgi:hypothetical protein
VCAATLNYECLQELAAARAGVATNYEGESQPDVLGVLKPHGSCNFLIGGDVTFSNVTIIGSEEVQNLVEGSIEPDVNLDGLEHRFRTEHSLPPAMSLYTETKQSPISPSLLADLRARWRQRAESADVIVVVGAQPYLKDAHIWDPILTSSAEVWYISGTTGNSFARLSGVSSPLSGCERPR